MHLALDCLCHLHYTDVCAIMQLSFSRCPSPPLTSQKLIVVADTDGIMRTYRPLTRANFTLTMALTLTPTLIHVKIGRKH